MIQVTITPDVLRRAEKKAALVGNIGGSITGSASHVVGAIGEVIVADLLGAEEVNSKDYDLIHKGKRIDVKTKRCNTAPRTYYDCSVAAHGTRQACDSYVFVRIKIDGTKAWVLGEIDKPTFYSNATYYRRGDVDPDNGFVFKADCYNLPISELRYINETQSTPV
jgi:hypothetical protein|tara:strand:+ start:129 stop:623 length:495 start_codon:yes stop_codon:yes gene_type:complete